MGSRARVILVTGEDLNFFALSIVYIFDERTTGGRSMRNTKQTVSPGAWLPNPDRRKTIVIADDGGRAEVVLLDATQPVQPGSCFDHAGRRWIIRGQRHHSRVLVAEPLSWRQQVACGVRRKNVRRKTGRLESRGHEPFNV